MNRRKHFIRVTAAHPRALLNSATITMGPRSRECGSLMKGVLGLPLASERVPIVTSRCISGRFKANYIGVAPTRSPGSFRIKHHRGLRRVGVLGSSTAVGDLNKGCTNVSHCRTHGTVMRSLGRRKLLMGIIPRDRDINARSHYNAAMRPVVGPR